MVQRAKRLYMVVFPINALVASQLDPEHFAEHYTIGSAKHYRGKMVFVEIDSAFRDPYFNIDKYLDLTVEHADGSPKRTKFIKSYGVLEHVDLNALKSLFLVLPNGKSLGLEQQAYTAENLPGFVRVYQEITPLTSLVASTLDQRSFAKYITGGSASKGAPKVVFTQYEFDVEEFMSTNRNRDILNSPFPDTNPRRLYEYLNEIKKQPNKKTKTISLSSTFGEISYSAIRHGFWFASGEQLVFYPLPTIDELNSTYYQWWKHVI